MKRIIALLAVALVGLAACSQRQPAPGSYAITTDAGRKEIHIIHGDCVAFNLEDPDGQMLASVGPFEKKGRYPRYTYKYRQGGSDFTITASFTDGAIDAQLCGRLVWGSNTIDLETTKPLTFTLTVEDTANFQQTDLDNN